MNNSKSKNHRSERSSSQLITLHKHDRSRIPLSRGVLYTRPRIVLAGRPRTRAARCHYGRVYRLQTFRTTFTTRANGVGREKQGPFLENETNSALTKGVLHLRADDRPRCTGRRSRGRRGKKAFLWQSIGFPQHAIAVEARAALLGVPLRYYYID